MIIDGINFSIKEVVLPTPRERIGNRYIGYDYSFAKNREIDCKKEVYDNIEFALIEKYGENFGMDFGRTGLYDYYLMEENLYVKLRLDRYSNFNAYNPTNKYHQNCLNELIKKNEVDFIREWCIAQPAQRKQWYKNNWNVLEVYVYSTPLSLYMQIDGIAHGIGIAATSDELRYEFNHIVKSKGNYNYGGYHNKLITYFNPHFYEQENKAYNDIIIRRKIIENSMAYLYKSELDLKDKDILLNFRFSKIGCNSYSSFSPLWIKRVLEEYSIKSVFDYCMGWGHRLLGCWDVDYYGLDIDERTVYGNKVLYECYTNNSTIKQFYQGDSSEFILNKKVDLCISCPPYFNYEDYLDENTSHRKYSNYNDWLNIWWKKTIENCLVNKPLYFGLFINNTYKDDMVNVCMQCGLKLIKDISIGRKVISHFQKGKQSKKGENLVLFKV